MIPVMLTSSASFEAPVLTFLPIGNSLLLFAPLPPNFTINFLGKDLMGLSRITAVFKLPGSIGVL